MPIPLAAGSLKDLCSNYFLRILENHRSNRSPPFAPTFRLRKAVFLTGRSPVTGLYPPVSAAVTGKWSKVTGSISWVTGRKPVTFSAYLSGLQVISAPDRCDQRFLAKKAISLLPTPKWCRKPLTAFQQVDRPEVAVVPASTHLVGRVRRVYEGHQAQQHHHRNQQKADQN